jgi:hypothetical protein
MVQSPKDCGLCSLAVLLTSLEKMSVRTLANVSLAFYLFTQTFLAISSAAKVLGIGNTEDDVYNIVAILVLPDLFLLSFTVLWWFCPKAGSNRLQWDVGQFIGVGWAVAFACTWAVAASLTGFQLHGIVLSGSATMFYLSIYPRKQTDPKFEKGDPVETETAVFVLFPS